MPEPDSSASRRTQSGDSKHVWTMLLWILPIFAGYKYWGRWRQQQQVGCFSSHCDHYSSSQVPCRSPSGTGHGRPAGQRIPDILSVVCSGWIVALDCRSHFCRMAGSASHTPTQPTCRLGGARNCARSLANSVPGKVQQATGYCGVFDQIT